MKYGTLMFRVGWISMMRQACIPVSSVAYKVIRENGLDPYRGYEHLFEGTAERHGPYFRKCVRL